MTVKILIPHKGEITLDKRHYVSAGGEGQIYAKGSTAYKIYLTSEKMIPVAKIKELSILQNPNIVSPQDVIMDASGKNIGYTMQYIKNVSALCQVFTKAFKDRNSIKADDVLKLVNQLRDNIEYCHKQGILLVDINEFNFLIDNDTYKMIYFIDVDSYQTPHYPATAIMDSIRDRHNKKFSIETDWFSFGVLSFQMFVGIHPFKGKHPDYKSLDQRMSQNVSVFNKQVSVPPTTLPFDYIPSVYREWYSTIFNSNTRIAPPFDGIVITVITPKTRIINGTNNFIIDFFREYEGDIIHIGEQFVLTTKGLYVDNKLDFKVAPYAHVFSTLIHKHIITAIVSKNKLCLYDATTGKDIAIDCNAQQLMVCGNRLYIKNEDDILELVLTEISPASMLCSTIKVGNIIAGATQVFDGVIIQNLLGKYYASIFPDKGRHFQIALDCLASFRIVDAKYENRILIVVGESQGKYSQFMFVIDNKFSSILRTQTCIDISFSTINFTTTDSGICVHETHEGFIELFYNTESEDIKLIKDLTLTGTKLFFIQGQMFFAKENKLYKVKMKA
jgi:serine/threonine protein kinase